MKKNMDFEYATNWYEEVKYLSSKGINYTFVKTNDGATTWKYKKEAILFLELFRFYEQVYSK